jgi:hypothetical protein
MDREMNSRRAARSSVVNERIDAKGRPVITLSIDLDMRWGARSQLGPVAHPIDAALLQIPELVHLMLVELDDFDLPTTWFVPAAVTCGSWDEYFATAPDDPRLLVNRQRITTEHRDSDPTGRLHFLPAVIEELIAGGRHELGTTGFSSLPVHLPGVTAADACVEVLAAIEHLEHVTGRVVRSVAFPNDDARHREHIETATRIRRYRGAPRINRDATPTAQLAERLRRVAVIRRTARSINDADTIDHSVRSGMSPIRWERELRAMARSASTAAVGENLHIRWATRPALADPLDVGLAVDRFRSMLDVISEGAQRSGAIIVPMQRLEHARHLAA